MKPPATQAGEVTHLTPGAWSLDQWRPAKSPRWPRVNPWRQCDDGLANPVPLDAPPEAWIADRVDETYACLMRRGAVGAPLTVTARLRFDDRMAAMLILADPPAEIAAPPGIELRRHWEIVLWDSGVNIWRHHGSSPADVQWVRLASVTAPVPAGAWCEMTVHVTAERELEVSVAGPGASLAMSVLDPTLPDELHVGVAGSEGRCRFAWVNLQGQPVSPGRPGSR